MQSHAIDQSLLKHHSFFLRFIVLFVEDRFRILNCHQIKQLDKQPSAIIHVL